MSRISRRIVCANRNSGLEDHFAVDGEKFLKLICMDQLCQFTDGDVFTDTDIDVLLFIVVTHEMEEGISDVIYIDSFDSPSFSLQNGGSP